MVEQCGGTVWWNSVVEQWNSALEQWTSDCGTVLVEQGWWNSETVIVEQCGGALQE